PGEIVGADEPAAQPLVHCGEPDVLHRRSDIDPPVGDRPVYLRPVLLDLVVLLVAAVVDLRRHAGHELGRAFADPGPEPHLDVVGLAAGGGHLATTLRLGHAAEAVPLAEP